MADDSSVEASNPKLVQSPLNNSLDLEFLLKDRDRHLEMVVSFKQTLSAG